MNRWAWTLFLVALSAGVARSQEEPSTARPPVELPARPSIPGDLQLTPQAGAWLVCAASFTGPESPSLAMQMARVLRQRDRLPAYVIDYAANEYDRQKAEYEEMQRRYPGSPIRPRFTRIQQHCAVLIGGFADVDKANAALPRIRKLPAPDLRLSNGSPAYDSVVNYEPGPNGGTQIKQATINPFAMAFATRNPTAPKPTQPDRTQDEMRMLKKLNANEEYSLLRCKGAYTLLVKDYTGISVVQQDTGKKGKGILGALGLGGNGEGEVLNAAALQAHELAKFLRNFNFETYVLHTRQGSLVTVGGFEGPDDARLKQMQQQLGALRFQGGASIDLLPNPLPIRVPKL